MSPRVEEAFFSDKRPLVTDVLVRLNQRTGIQASCIEHNLTEGANSFSSIYVLTNPADEFDFFDLYYEGESQLYVCWDGPTTYLVGATLHTLIAMGGYYDSKIPIWTSKKWSEVAEKVKSLPRYEHPDWVFD